MIGTRHILCSSMVLCPACFVAAVSEHNLRVSDGYEDRVLSVRGHTRVSIQTSTSGEPGGRLTRTTVSLTLSLPDDSLTRALSHTPYSRWVARLVADDGTTYTLGTTDYPASLAVETTDNSLTLTLSDTQPAQ